LAQAFSLVNNQSDASFNRDNFQIRFQGEIGADAGGLTEDFVAKVALKMETLSGKALTFVAQGFPYKNE